MSTLERPRILIVEDEEAIQNLYAELLGDSVEVVKAISRSDVINAFLQNRRHPHLEFDMVVMDGEVPLEVWLKDRMTDTVQLVRDIRSGWGGNGLILAVSNDKDLQGRMVYAGCNFAVDKNNIGFVAKLIKEKLGV